MLFREAILAAEKADSFAHNSQTGIPILCFMLDRSSWDILWRPFDSRHWRAGGIHKLMVHQFLVDDGWSVYEGTPGDKVIYIDEKIR